MKTGIILISIGFFHCVFRDVDSMCNRSVLVEIQKIHEFPACASTTDKMVPDDSQNSLKIDAISTGKASINEIWSLSVPLGDNHHDHSVM